MLVLGPKHLEKLISMNDLALKYQFLGRYHEAAYLGAEILELKEEVFGPKHPITLVSMAHLISVYQSLGQHSEAAHLTRKLSSSRKRFSA